MATAKKTASKPATPATSKNTPSAKAPVLVVPEDVTKMPEGFVPAFNRVEMPKDGPNARVSDGLCCVAMLTGQPLVKITDLAYELGIPKHGPTWIYNDTLRRLLAHFDLVASGDMEISSVDALPAVAIVTADYNPATLFGRNVLFHHMAGDGFALNYVIDPAYWTNPKHHITRDFAHLWTPKQPLYYMGITPKQAGKTRGK